MSQYTIPTVVEKTPNGERAFDIYSQPAAVRHLLHRLTISAATIRPVSHDSGVRRRRNAHDRDATRLVS